MVRYLIACGDKFVAAAQPDTKHILLTSEREDAGSWSTYERTIKAARFVQDVTGTPVVIQQIREPDYPRSWDLAKNEGDVV